jgi:hypothetical protein
MKRGWLVGVVVLATAVTVRPAAASPHDDYGYGRGQSRYGRNGAPAYGIGFDKGYEDGLHHGRKDGDQRRGYEFRHDGRYRDGDHGYRSSYGSRYAYVQGYRRGYEAGYKDGFEAYGFRGGHGRDGRYGRYDDRGYDRNRRDDRYDPYDRDDDVIYELPRRY